MNRHLSRALHGLSVLLAVSALLLEFWPGSD